MYRTLLALTISLSPLASGAIYYVDSAAGSDAQSGVSPAAAWKTLAHVAASNFSPGDFILLKRGSTWYEPFTMPSSGVQDVPITVGAYGTGGAFATINGTTLGANPTDLFVISGKTDIVVTGLQITAGPQNGMNIYSSTRITLNGIAVSSNQFAGIEIYNSNSVTVQGSEVNANGLNTNLSYDGIRIDGSGIELSGFIVQGCHIHNNVGGLGWNSDNGITVGHTGGTTPILRGVQIIANDLSYNGNPTQNQAGRGLTGTFTGDITITSNYVHNNASAGIYVGDEGINVAITISQNVFYDNALRQFGGFTTNTAQAFHNAMFVDNGSITAMGAEVGGAGYWTIVNNVFYYQTTSSDTYRGFVTSNDATQDANLEADCNLYFSPGPNRWHLSNDLAIMFQQWQALGFDLDGFNPH
jgi:hypothetical protein